MITAKDIAQFFIKKGLDEDESDVTNLKLQKLLYYSKGFHQAIFNKPLYNEQLFAWSSGFVVPEIYYEYKKYGNHPITDFEYNPCDKFNEEQLDLLHGIWSVFGKFSSWKLRDMILNEKTWLDHEKDASAIEDYESFDYFQTRLTNIK